jgi:phytoene dehydrogenase-like protein
MEPDWIPPAVARLIGIKPDDFGPSASASVLLDDGMLMTLPPNAGAASLIIQKYSPRDAARWPAFTATLHALSGFLGEMYQQPAPDVGMRSMGELPSMLALGRSYRALGRRNMSELLRVLPLPVQDLATDWLTFEPLQAMVVAAGARDIRQGPRSGGTTFNLLHYLIGAEPGAVRGRPPLKAGATSMIAASERCARAHGVTIRTGTTVAQVNVADDAVTGVTLSTGEVIKAAKVLSTADPTSTLQGMIDPVWLDPEFLRAVGNIRYRGCTAYVAFAVDLIPDAIVRAGLVSLSASTDAIERPFDSSKYAEASHRPHVELKAVNPNTLLARVQYIPHSLRDGSWDASRKSALTNLVMAAAARAIPGFSKHVRQASVLTPPDLAERFGIREGAMTHGEITLDQILFMRPVAGWGRYAMPVAGLYLGGAGTHPGPGIAGGPGLLAAERALLDWKKRK